MGYPPVVNNGALRPPAAAGIGEADGTFFRCKGDYNFYKGPDVVSSILMGDLDELAGGKEVFWKSSLITIVGPHGELGRIVPNPRPRQRGRRSDDTGLHGW